MVKCFVLNKSCGCLATHVNKSNIGYSIMIVSCLYSGLISTRNKLSLIIISKLIFILSCTRLLLICTVINKNTFLLLMRFILLRKYNQTTDIIMETSMQCGV